MTATLRAALAAHPFCRGLLPDDLDRLLPHATVRAQPEGARLCRAGAEARHAWLILDGRIGLELFAAGSKVPLETAEAGELVGWSWLFPPYHWHFDAVALAPTRVIELDGEALRLACEAEPAFGYRIMKAALMQAQQRLERSRLQALNVYGSMD